MKALGSNVRALFLLLYIFLLIISIAEKLMEKFLAKVLTFLLRMSIIKVSNQYFV